MLTPFNHTSKKKCTYISIYHNIWNTIEQNLSDLDDTKNIKFHSFKLKKNKTVIEARGAVNI